MNIMAVISNTAGPNMGKNAASPGKENKLIRQKKKSPTFNRLELSVVKRLFLMALERI
jgi:hypothetical protein